MALNARDFTLPGQWAKDANTTIPPIPVSGQPYRNAALAKAIIENGQNYDNIADSAVWNQLMYLASGMSLESEVYGIPRWSPLTDYVGDASLAIGTDGIPYRAILPSGPDSPAGAHDPVTTTGYWMRLSKWIVDNEAADYWLLKRLTANLGVYVATTGSDTIGDGSVSNPWKTIQFAVDTVAETYFLGPYSVTVNVAAGMYNENVNLPDYLSTLGRISIIGDSYNTTFVIGISVAGHINNFTFYLNNASKYDISRLTVYAPVDTDDTSQDDCVRVISGEIRILGCNFVIPPLNSISFGINASDSGTIWLLPSDESSNITITAQGATGTDIFLFVNTNGTIYQSVNLTLNGIAQNAAIYATEVGIFYRSPSALPTISGSATGKRYNSTSNGIINTNGGGPNYIPGTVAGTTSSGGQYL